MKFVSGALRALLLAGGVAMIVVGAHRVPERFTIADPVVRTGPGEVTTTPVSTARLYCPGPQTLGLASAQPVEGMTTVAATTAPPGVLPAIATPAPAAGAMSLDVMGLAQAGATELRGALLSGSITTPHAAALNARGGLAPGLTGLQTWVRGEGPERALVTTACQPVRSEAWLLAGGGQAARRERVVIVNPGAAAITVDVQVRGALGIVPGKSPAPVTVSVPPAGREVLLLDALAPGEPSPVVHLVASGGEMVAVLNDSWIEGTAAKGSADSTPSAGPSTSLVIPGTALIGHGTLRVATAGTSEAVVQLRLFSAAGPVSFPGGGVVRVPGGGTVDVPLAGLNGWYAIQLTSDQPVVAAAMVEHPGSSGDFAWVPATDPVTVIAGTPLVAPVTAAALHLAAPQGATVKVFAVKADGSVRPQDVTVPEAGTAGVDVSGSESAWVVPVKGTVYAAAVMTADDQKGPMFGIVPLLPAPATTSSIPLRDVEP